ncbi:hypothetical protein L596_006926 [Steinernema carpocapsae]|uniref:Uncharacterized protein n=1 Tax=Steinernema carpocapsae TaxID=34508 RepID=A0A4U5P8E3_STECR|nr:hypothetical protein L596_006926 [Steinernema carpocapsae]
MIFENSFENHLMVTLIFLVLTFEAFELHVLWQRITLCSFHSKHIKSTQSRSNPGERTCKNLMRSISNSQLMNLFGERDSNNTFKAIG